MMLTTKYITKDDYKQYFGEDLDAVLPDDDMPEGKAERFICGVEDDVAIFLDVKCFKRIDNLYPNMSEYQKECYKKALLNQCKYKLHNGDIGNNSGLDSDAGIVARRGELESIELSSKTVKYLIACGLYNRNIRPRKFGGRFFFF